jgi:hypothetical protein
MDVVLKKKVLLTRVWSPLFFPGVLLAVLETLEIIAPIYASDNTITNAGTVSAGYQNFLVRYSSSSLICLSCQL